MFCRWCGKQIDVGLTKCKYCGNQLDALEAIGISNGFMLNENDNSIQNNDHINNNNNKNNDPNDISIKSEEKKILEAKINRLQVCTIILGILVVYLSIALLITH